MKKNTFHLFLTAGLAVLTLTALLRSGMRADIPAILRGGDWRFLAAGAAAFFAFLLLESLSLRTLFESFGIRLRLSRMIRYTLADFYVSSITPGACGGQPAKLYFMSRDRLPLGVSSLCVLLFNTCYHLSMLLIVGAGLAAGALRPITQHPALRWLLLYGALIQLGLVLLFLSLAFSRTLAPSLLHGLISLLGKLRILKHSDKWHAKLEEQSALYRSGSRFFRENPLRLLRVLALTTLHLLLFYSLPYWVYRALGLSGAGFFSVLLLQAGLTIGVESLPIPGGLGASEGAFLLVYASVFPRELLLSALVLSRGISYYLGLLAGGVSTWLLKKQPVLLSPFALRLRRKNREHMRKRYHLRGAAPSLPHWQCSCAGGR